MIDRDFELSQWPEYEDLYDGEEARADFPAQVDDLIGQMKPSEMGEDERNDSVDLTPFRAELAELIAVLRSYYPYLLWDWLCRTDPTYRPNKRDYAQGDPARAREYDKEFGKRLGQNGQRARNPGYFRDDTALSTMALDWIFVHAKRFWDTHVLGPTGMPFKPIFVKDEALKTEADRMENSNPSGRFFFLLAREIDGRFDYDHCRRRAEELARHSTASAATAGKRRKAEQQRARRKRAK